MRSFQCFYYLVFQKKQLLYLRWLLGSLLRYLTKDLILLGLFDRNVGLTTKCAMVKVSKNIVEEEPLTQTQVNMTNTKNKPLNECVNKNSRRLTVAYAGFSKWRGRPRKLENNEDQKKTFSTQNQSVFLPKSR